MKLKSCIPICLMSKTSVCKPLKKRSVPLCRKPEGKKNNQKGLVLLSSNSATHSLRTLRTTQM